MVVASLKSPLQAQTVYADLLESLIFDVASEAHRAARLGFDYRLQNDEEDEAQMSGSGRATVGDVDTAAPETSGKYTVDVFGQTHPAIAQDNFDCMNCGRAIVAGRFAPHLEKCMGKGRKARLKPNSSVGGIQPRRGRAAAPVPGSVNNSNNASHSRSSSRLPARTAAAATPQDSHRSGVEVNGITREASPEADKDLLPGPPHPGKARTKKSSLKVPRTNPGSQVTPIPFGGIVGRGGSVPDTSLGSVSGLVSGMAVPVAVETDASVSASNLGVNNKQMGPGSAVRNTSTVKGRKTNEKKRNIGQVLAGTSNIGNGGTEDLEGRRSVEVRVEKSDTSLMLPFRDPTRA